MNLYLVKSSIQVWYDEYDGAVVLAESEEEALKSASFVTAPATPVLIGKAVKGLKGVTVRRLENEDGPVILASFNAG